MMNMPCPFYFVKLISLLLFVLRLATTNLVQGTPTLDDDTFAVSASSVLDVTSTVQCILKGTSATSKNKCIDKLKETMKESDEFYYNTGLPFSFGNVKVANLTSVVGILNNAYATAKGSAEHPGIFVTFLITDPQTNFKNITDSPERQGIEVVRNLSGLILDWKVNKSLCDTPANVKMHLADLKNLAEAKIGIAYSSQGKNKCLPSSVDLSLAHFIQIGMDFDILTFIPSYELFKDELTKIVNEHDDYKKRSIGSKRTFYNLRFTSAPGEPEYYSLFVQFVITWARETSHKIILDTNHFSSNAFRTALQTRIDSPFNFKKHIILGVSGNGACEPCALPYRDMVTLIGSTFNSVLLSYETLTCTIKCWHHNNNSTDDLRGLGGMPEVYVSRTLGTIEKSLNSSERTMEDLSQKIKPVSPVFLLPTRDFENAASLNKYQMVKLVQKLTKVSFGCEVDLGRFDLTNSSKIENFLNAHRCQDVFPEVGVFVWKFIFDARGDEYKDVFNKLENLRKVGNSFVKKYLYNPKKTYIIWIALPRGSKTLDSSSLYCDETTRKFNLYTEIVGNWARIRNVKVILHEAFDLDSTPSWWNYLQAPNLVKNSVTFQAVMRNYPATMWSSQTAPCIRRPKEYPKDGIKFNDNSGVSLDLNIKASLSEDEVATMMQFAFYKFSLVEILIQTELVGLTANMENFSGALKIIWKTPSEPFPKRLYVQFAVPESKSDLASQGLQKVFESTVKKLMELKQEKNITVGIHISRWEKHENESALKTFFHLCKSHKLDVGLTVDNCISNLNNITTPNKKSPLTPHLSNVNVTYLVCQEGVGNATNKDLGKMTSFLDGHFVVEKAFRKLFPSIQHIFFRLQSVSMKSVSAEQEFLAFTNDVVQHSTLYNVSYFLFPALSNKGASGWWRVTSTADLKTVKNYIEREANYLKKEMWRPNPFARTRFSSLETGTSTSQTFIIAGALALLGLAILVLAVALWIRKRKYPPFLSKAEVSEFHLGSVRPDSEYYSMESECVAGENIYTMLKFNEEYKLAKKNFEIDFQRILGTGNFGTVYKGKVSGIEVAVKVQHLGCSKDTFKSMLNEVKILSWIGSAPNVLAFVGCYTKEIQKGVIYIATELCPHGCLQAHLRTTYSHPERMYENLENAGVSELVRFATEIALGMDYIASRKVVHGDLSTRNVLLDANDACKIGDFGLSRKLYEYNKYVKSNHEEPLPWRWMALESLKFMEFTTKSDMWGYGVTLWEIFSLGEVPFGGRAWSVDFRDEVEKGMRLTKPHLSTDAIYDKMMQCWNLDADLRPTFQDMRAFFEGLK